jgi:hypothetical protein
MSTAMENIALTNAQQKSLLQGFPDRILPLVTSKDNTVKQAAVSCLGKYALFADKGLFSAVLIDLTKNHQEKLEIRARALLALCDLALLEACVKLFLCGKMLSQVVLAQLIIIFFTLQSFCPSVLLKTRNEPNIIASSH